ncbi:hypothetical protein L484_027685 [Morus notabilis]|uniref:Uncharacterized protein n=1 Tax=Morus notabilis TaxID=981085 RepID=W9S1G4_9ROSA|nr:hypothetical protein L484_027685 [Morus notabilis]
MTIKQIDEDLASNRVAYKILSLLSSQSYNLSIFHREARRSEEDQIDSTEEYQISQRCVVWMRKYDSLTLKLGVAALTSGAVAWHSSSRPTSVAALIVGRRSALQLGFLAPRP